MVSDMGKTTTYQYMLFHMKDPLMEYSRIKEMEKKKKERKEQLLKQNKTLRIKE